MAPAAPPTLVWLRNDLRLADNPALHAAAARGPLVPLYVWSPDEEGRDAAGAASRWWLGRSLAALAADLERHGSRLILRRGPSLEALLDLCQASGARSVCWNRRVEPVGAAHDVRVASALQASGIEVSACASNLLVDPEELRTGAGSGFQVFTPYWRAFRRRPPPAAPLPAPRRLLAPPRWPHTASLAELGLNGEPRWAAGLAEHWRPGERGALRRLARLTESKLADYPEDRERPAHEGTSRLSPHLHFGEISARQVYHTIEGMGAASERPGIVAAAEVFTRQLGWREFAHDVLFHHPETPQRPLRPAFEGLAWRRDEAALTAWQRGRTGYPIVDAGMRELWTTGWMHNRVRMIVASFLVKDLLLSWQEGARWFWDTLVDADLANNTFGWQWAGGCGADAAPYFRIFNPVAQGQRFDADGSYVRRWVPELAAVPARWIHRPWMAPGPILRDAGVTVGETYPTPIVDHALARARALDAFGALRRASAR